MADQDNQERRGSRGTRGRGGNRRGRGQGPNQGQKQRPAGNRSPGRGHEESRNKKGNKSRGKKQLFVAHLTEADVAGRLEEGTLCQGVLRVNRFRRTEAYVTVRGFPKDWLVKGDGPRNRAVHGDTVLVELLPEDQWEPLEAPAAEAAEAAGAGRATVAGLSTAFQALNLSDIQDARDDVPLTGAAEEALAQELWRPLHPDAVTAPIALETEEKAPEDDEEAVQGMPPALARARATVMERRLRPLARVVRIQSGDVGKEHMGRLTTFTAVEPGQPVSERDSNALFVPMDQRIPRFSIRLRDVFPTSFLQDPHAFANDVFTARVREWKEEHRTPQGVIVQHLGRGGTVATEVEALLRENGVDHGEFPEAVMEELRGYLPPEEDGHASAADSNWAIPDSEYAYRRDLRDTRVFSIDPTTAKDLDDALHVTPLEDGTIEVGVHIADVSYFVREKTSLDAEAFRRATSVYLVTGVIPMLPPILCEQLCSLNPDVERLAFSVIWRMNRDGSLPHDHQPWFGRTVIRSCCKLDYGIAQRVIAGEITADGPAPTPEQWPLDRRPTGGHTEAEVMGDVLIMEQMARNRRLKRLRAGALVLSQPKLVFGLDEDGWPVTVGTYPIKDSNKLIEEYMLMANYLVAEKLAMGIGSRALLRRHPPPTPNKLIKFVELMHLMGLPMDGSSGPALAASFRRLARPGAIDPADLATMYLLCMEPMNTAEYFCIGDNEASYWRHFALCMGYYTHFTSPIRRYADLQVHRQLWELCCNEDASLPRHTTHHADEAEVEGIAEQCNEKKGASKEAQDRCDDVFFAMLLSRAPIESELGVVVSLGAKAFTVFVPAYGVKERIYVDKVPGDGTGAFDEEQQKLVLQPRSRNPMLLQIFTRVRVRLVGVIEPPPAAIKLEFQGLAS